MGFYKVCIRTCWRRYTVFYAHQKWLKWAAIQQLLKLQLIFSLTFPNEAAYLCFRALEVNRLCVWMPDSCQFQKQSPWGVMLFYFCVVLTSNRYILLTLASFLGKKCLFKGIVWLKWSRIVIFTHFTHRDYIKCCTWEKLCELLFSMQQDERISLDIKVSWDVDSFWRLLVKISPFLMYKSTAFCKKHHEGEKTLHNFHFSPNDSFKAATCVAGVCFNWRVLYWQ